VFTPLPLRVPRPRPEVLYRTNAEEGMRPMFNCRKAQNRRCAQVGVWQPRLPPGACGVCAGAVAIAVWWAGGAADGCPGGVPGMDLTRRTRQCVCGCVAMGSVGAGRCSRWGWRCGRRGKKKGVCGTCYGRAPAGGRVSRACARCSSVWCACAARRSRHRRPRGSVLAVEEDAQAAQRRSMRESVQRHRQNPPRMQWM